MAGPSPAFLDPMEGRSDRQVSRHSAPHRWEAQVLPPYRPPRVRHQVSLVAGGSQQRLLLQKAEAGGEAEPSSALFPGDSHTRGLLVMAL